MNTILALTALANVVCAILAWVAKIWWGREYREAKDETIRAKEAQIEVLKTELENLRQFSPLKLREYYLSIKEQSEDVIEDLSSKLKLKERENEALQAKVERESQKLEQAKVERESYELAKLQEEIVQLKAKVETYGTVSVGMDTALASLDSWISGKTKTDVRTIASTIILRKELEDGSYETAFKRKKMQEEKSETPVQKALRQEEQSGVESPTSRVFAEGLEKAPEDKKENK